MARKLYQLSPEELARRVRRTLSRRTRSKAQQMEETAAEMRKRNAENIRNRELRLAEWAEGGKRRHV
jgi:hypothetical protein